MLAGVLRCLSTGIARGTVCPQCPPRYRPFTSLARHPSKPMQTFCRASGLLNPRFASGAAPSSTAARLPVYRYNLVKSAKFRLLTPVSQLLVRPLQCCMCANVLKSNPGYIERMDMGRLVWRVNYNLLTIPYNECCEFRCMSEPFRLRALAVGCDSRHLHRSACSCSTVQKRKNEASAASGNVSTSEAAQLGDAAAAAAVSALNHWSQKALQILFAAGLAVALLFGTSPTACAAVFPFAEAPAAPATLEMKVRASPRSFAQEMSSRFSVIHVRHHTWLLFPRDLIFILSYRLSKSAETLSPNFSIITCS